MSESLKGKTISGVIWSGVDKIGYDIVQFIVELVMARLLLPSDYGIIGILLIFTTFAQIFVDGGFTTALIQKNDRTKDDINTAFIYNIFTSFIIYSILFVLSPIISSFYGDKELISFIRVYSLILIISSFSSIHGTLLTIRLDFKKLSFITISSGLVSGAIGVICALSGLGVWALIFQQLSMAGIRTLLLVFIVKWKFSFSFSKESFKYLFKFGSNLIMTNTLARVYDNLYPIIIGKLYPFSTLGLYTRGKQFAGLPANIFNSIFMKVSFPVLSSVKNETDRVKNGYRSFIGLSSFIIFPSMTLLILLAKPIVIILLTEKWLDTVPFIQILCVGLMFNHINSINLNLLYVFGRSDLAFKLEIIKKTTATLILFISTFWGIWGICIGQSLYNIVAVALNSMYTKKLIGLSFWVQLSDYGPVWIISVVSLVLTYFIPVPDCNIYIFMIICLIIYIAIYYIICKMTSLKSLEILEIEIKKRFKS